ncbi:FtsK/SpoIIIE family DNA translocase [Acidiluteibacter ferrifornacis]|uniref:DNA translocase FtsK n=1 Tax=Acidiluteibacter ferrifornacis TaxID=2692424 RepID=A0A6N9NJC6_9FLAO|nr:DNA translocase FtsK [Acidiluteibacter ferrifornacis]NBG65962.1 DNA translocase FtsK [Acidiluteibacter ferrifornacis]
MAKNQFKSDKTETPASEKESKQKKGKLFKGPKQSFQSFGSFIKDEKTKNVTGLLFILLSAFLLVAFSSFLFTWEADQSKLELSLGDFLWDPEIVAENWLGKFGAAASHVFIYKWFGIASFIFVVLTFLVGFKILFKISLLPIRRSFRISFFGIIFTSLLMSYFFNQSLFFLGGGFGYQVNIWLQSVIGFIGTGFLIIFSFLTFLTISFNLSFSGIFKKNETSSDEETIKTNTEATAEKVNSLHSNEEVDLEDELAIEDEFSEEEMMPTLKKESKQPEDDEQQQEIILEPTAVEEKENQTTEEDKAFSFEVAQPEDSSGEEEEEVGLEIEDPIEDDELSDEELDSRVAEFGEYDPTLDLPNYKNPPIDILKEYGSGSIKVDKEELEANKNRIVKTLENYNIKIDSIKATVGPTVTLYEIVPAPGVRISKIKNLEDDIALSLAALGIRIIAPIPGRGTIGIEVPNQNPDIVSMRSVIASEKFQTCKYELPVVMGKTISNETFVFDLAKMPHLLMAGATGQGKSVGLNAVLASLLYKKHPAQLKFVLVDPKKVELTLFNKIERHFLAKLPDTEDAIITDNQKVINTLNSLCIEMDTRYELLKTAFVRNIKEYNTKFIKRKLSPEKGHKYLPYIVVVIDEFADLIMTAGKEVEQPIARIAQLARAIGIHLIIATQRPSTNIITGSIKANFPARIAFRVTSGIDSRTILDSGGAEQLIGRGDMLLSNGSDLIRLQCAFIDTPEVELLTEFIGNQRAYPDAFLLPEYIDENGGGAAGDVDLADRDALFEDAARIIVQHQQGSASLLQRRLKLGYNRAGRIVDQLEAAGIIGPFEGSKARQVLIQDEASLEQYLNNMD